MQIVLGHHAPGLSNGQTIKVILAEAGLFFFFYLLSDLELTGNTFSTSCTLKSKILQGKDFQVVNRDGNQFSRI